MATSEGIPSSIDIEFLELNDNPYSTLCLRQPEILAKFPVKVLNLATVDAPGVILSLSRETL